MLSRKERADIRTQSEYQQRMESIESWIRNVENCTSMAMDSESQQVGLFKMLLREVEKARRIDKSTIQDVDSGSKGPEKGDSIKSFDLFQPTRKRMVVAPELLCTMDVDELEELRSLVLHTAQKKREYLEKYPNITPSGSKRLNLDETPKVSTQNKLAFDSDQARETLSALGTQNRNKEIVPRDYFLMINKEQIINPKYTTGKARKKDSRYEKDPEYETDSEYELDPDYQRVSSESETEHGVIAMFVANPQETEFGYCFTSGAIPIEYFSGNADEDLLSWLQKFEDNFYVSRDASLKTHLHDAVKAKHLIAKLQDPARSRVQTLSATDRNSYNAM